MESVQLEHENVTQLVLVSLRDGVEEGRRLSNEEKDPFERIDRGAVWGENLMFFSGIVVHTIDVFGVEIKHVG